MNAANIDTTDVMPVAAAELALVLRFVAGGRRALLSGRAICESELLRVEQAFWSRVDADPARKLAVLIRFRSMAAAMDARRVASVLAEQGQAAVPALLEAAATLRLNVAWGLNTNRLLWRLSDSLETSVPRGEALAA